MTKIEFVLMADAASDTDTYNQVHLQARTALNKGGLFVYAPNCDEARAVDQYLWDAENTEFIPHLYVQARADEETVHTRGHANVLIACDGEPDGSHRTLLNLASEVPWFFSRFEQLLELVRSGANERKMGRERYLFYKRRGYPLRHRQL